MPLPRKFMNFSSQNGDMVHSGCVVFKIHVSHGFIIIIIIDIFKVA